MIALRQTSVQKYGCLIKIALIQRFKWFVGLCPTGESDCSYGTATERCRRFATQAKTDFFRSLATGRVGCVLHTKKMPSASDFSVYWDNRRYLLLGFFCRNICMITDHSKRPEDGARIVDVNEAWALRYWTQELGVTERELRETVEVVGPVLSDVKRILAR